MANIKNLAAGTVKTGPGTSGPTMVLDTGYGNTMPAVPFYLTCTPQGQISTLGNSEIVLATDRSGDSLTITRAQKGTTAKDIQAGWVVANGVYAEDIFGSTSFVTHEVPTGAVNGTNNSFTTASPFVGGTLEYFENGVRQSLGAGHYTETSPSTGVFTTSDAPAAGTVIGVKYQKAVSTTGNADTVDGFHASQVPTANTIPVLDSSGKMPAATLPTDTGWTTITMNTGYTTSVLEMRKVADRVYARGFVKADSGNIPTSTTNVATLPASLASPTFELFQAEGGSAFRINTNLVQVAAAGTRTSMYVSGANWSTT